MNKQEFSQKLNSRDIVDDNNPALLFRLTSTDLLVSIIRNEIDPREIAFRELENRGLDNNGKWVGFKQ